MLQRLSVQGMLLKIRVGKVDVTVIGGLAEH